MDIITQTPFIEDTLKGLTSDPKHLSSKYFYDEKGDRLFQQIMRCEDYYLTNCEEEIFSQQTHQILEKVLKHISSFDIVELGAGDCFKSIHLLRAVQKAITNYTFYPIDISEEISVLLEKELPPQLPDVQIEALTGAYLTMLNEAYKQSHKPKLILFLGSSIGNMTPNESISFFSALRNQMRSGDLLLVGFDLKKHPRTILNAYNDREGFTKAFNLNLLERINRELDADFQLDQFDHYPTYDPATGLCKSYLISLCKQKVCLKQLDTTISFDKNEYILMERSQKYSIDAIQSIASQIGFSTVQEFTDSKNWFVDVLWEKA